MIEGTDALRLLAAERRDQVVVTHMSTNFDWAQVSPRPELDIALNGAMGKASSLGLGIALARPDVGVWVLDGDGSLLMNLGTLVTVANAAPKNFLHVLYENGTYDTTGGQPIPGHGAVDFAQVAKAAGYARTYTFEAIEDFQNRLKEIVTGPHPTLAVLKVRSRERRPSPGIPSTAQSYARLRELLAAPSLTGA